MPKVVRARADPGRLTGGDSSVSVLGVPVGVLPNAAVVGREDKRAGLRLQFVPFRPISRQRREKPHSARLPGLVSLMLP